MGEGMLLAFGNDQTEANMRSTKFLSYKETNVWTSTSGAIIFSWASSGLFQ